MRGDHFCKCIRNVGEKKMKKIILAGLTLTIVLLFSSCGDKTENDLKNSVSTSPIDASAASLLPKGVDESEVLYRFTGPQISAVMYNDQNRSELRLTDNSGKTWYSGTIPTVTVAGADWGPFTSAMMGFTSESDGWMIGSIFIGLGTQYNFVFRTNDAGKKWTETGNVNDAYARVLLCGGFADQSTGFLCFRVDSDFFPAYMTSDGGKTWSKVVFPSIEEPAGTYYDMTKLSFSSIEYQIQLTNHDTQIDGPVLASKDHGLTWIKLN